MKKAWARSGRMLASLIRLKFTRANAKYSKRPETAAFNAKLSSWRIDLDSSGNHLAFVAFVLVA